VGGWSDLASLGVTLRPLSNPRPPESGRYSQFSASLTSTVNLLYTELRALDATKIVIELDIRERDLRIDGLPRADAKPAGDAVAISFDSRFGPLRYATGEYTGRWGIPGWQQNLRAIALSMQALRAVDRYGVSKRGEQYTGWRQIPASTDPADAIQTRQQALDFLGQWMSGDQEQIGSVIRRALKATHPDAGGDADTFRQVIRAKELVAG
jgi:hypothetical protein